MPKQLLFSVTKKDLDIDFYKASGKGGQKRNKCETAVRITHRESGIMVTASEQRSQHQNLQVAFKRLCENQKFKSWLRVESAKRMVNQQEREKEIQRKVENDMREENLKIEYYTPCG
jgi:protein subunit release factor B